MCLDEKLGIPSMVTPGVKKSTNVIKTLGGDLGTCRSIHVEYPVDRLRYDGFSAIIMHIWPKFEKNQSQLALRMQLERKIGRKRMRRW